MIGKYAAYLETPVIHRAIERLKLSMAKMVWTNYCREKLAVLLNMYSHVGNKYTSGIMCNNFRRLIISIHDKHSYYNILTYQNHPSPTMRLPTNNMLITWITKDCMKLGWERLAWSFSRFSLEIIIIIIWHVIYL